jgi:transposase
VPASSRSHESTVIDLTGTRAGTGPLRLLDMGEGRSKQALRQWLAAREQCWRDQVEVVAMDGFTGGSRPPLPRNCPTRSWLMDPFQVVRLAGEGLDQCRHRVHNDTHGHRGRKADPLCSARRTLHTGAELLTDQQRGRLTGLFAADEHVQVEATWGIDQPTIAAYREPDRAPGRDLITALIDAVSQGVPEALHEAITLGRTLTKRVADVMAWRRRPKRAVRGAPPDGDVRALGNLLAGVVHRLVGWQMYAAMNLVRDGVARRVRVIHDRLVSHEEANHVG